ncbi:MAG: MiaB/RimO family radical SAM methylthiotransferase [Chloroflexi bacterium]|nr:MiaB/RimO family radical SAM methylthiotransferase [Chloroflexota bacterium]
MNYHIWTEGCQMNVADSQRVASELEKLGYRATRDAESADVIVLNTCVVRQSAEDKAYSRLMSLKPLKQARPDLVLSLMGCLVGVRDASPLQKRFPFVDVFLPPSDPAKLVALLRARGNVIASEAKQSPDLDIGRWTLDFGNDASSQAVQHPSSNLQFPIAMPGDDFDLMQRERETSYELMDADLVLPAHERGNLVSAHIPIVYGCNHVCTFCIIPYRRGAERSRSIGEIAAETRALVQQGVREITLLGQIVDRYGYDVADGPRLPDLLRAINAIDGLERIRFLTSHPLYMTDDLLDAIATLPKVCEHIEVPVQAGDDAMLTKMKRGYTVDEYRALIAKIRARIPHASIATDIIVGMPGETEEQFLGTYNLLKELQLDVAHVAMFSPRPNTVAARWDDDVPLAEKERRRKAIDDLQAEIVGAINARFLGQTVEVLVEEKSKNRWKGRTRTNKLVFFADESRDWKAQLARVQIEWTGPWSMIGQI